MTDQPQQNPYASPASDAVTFDAQPATSQFEAIRREHIGHETSLKSIGLLYLLSAIFLIPAGSIMLVVSLMTFADERAAEDAAIMAPLSVLYLGLGVLSAALFFGFRRLQRWVKIPATILAVLGLLSIPIGTIINGYILYLIYSQKGKMVFSDRYKEIIAQTPGVKYRTSPVVMALLILLILLLVGGCLAGILLG